MNCYALHAINMSKLKQQDAIYLFVIEVRLLWKQRSLELRESSGILVLVYNKNCPLSACLPLSFYASLCPRHLFLNFRKKMGCLLIKAMIWQRVHLLFGAPLSYSTSALWLTLHETLDSASGILLMLWFLLNWPKYPWQNFILLPLR